MRIDVIRGETSDSGGGTVKFSSLVRVGSVDQREMKKVLM